MPDDVGRRLRIRSGDRVVIVGEDAELIGLLQPLPTGVTVGPPGPSDARVVLVAATDLGTLPDLVRRGGRAVHEHGTVWVIWRDRTPGVHLASVRRIVTMAGLVPAGTTRVGSERAALSATRDRDDRTFRNPGLRV